jgi:hypothetical protein
MKKHFLTGHALPLPRGRFSRCATVATGVAREKLFCVERNVARSVALAVASNVDGEKHCRVAWRVVFEVAIHVANAMRDCALNAAPVVASVSRLLVHPSVASTVDSLMNRYVISPDALVRFRNTAAQVERGVASVLRWLFTHLLPRLLTAL